MLWPRALVIYPVVIILFRFLGRSLGAKARPYDRAVEILLGSAASALIISPEIPLWRALVALTVLAGMHTVLDYLSLWDPAKKVLVGEPALLVEHGQFDKPVLKRHQISVDQVIGAMREKGFHDPAEVESVFLETSGKLSVVPKASYRPLRPHDLGLKPAQRTPAHIMITDGVINRRNLARAGKDEAWLKAQLYAKGAGSPKEVLLATLDAKGDLFVVRNRDVPLIQAVLEGVPDPVRLPNLAGFGARPAEDALQWEVPPSLYREPSDLQPRH